MCFTYTAQANADFYGFLGERPFAPSFERVDFTGFQRLECLNVTLVTQADEPEHLGTDWLRLESSLGSEVPQVAAVRIAVMEDVAAAVWRDNANATFATGILQSQLPPLQLLRQTASGAGCQLNCWDAVSIKVATRSGRHGLANIRATHSSVMTGFRVSVEYYSYTVGGIQRSVRQLSAGPPASDLLWGLSVFGNSESTSSVTLTPDGEEVIVDATAWPQQASQWTISTKMQERCCANLNCRDWNAAAGHCTWLLTSRRFGRCPSHWIANGQAHGQCRYHKTQVAVQADPSLPGRSTTVQIA